MKYVNPWRVGIIALLRGGKSIVNQQVSFISGGTVLVRRKAWEIVGPQDEKLCMYQDERDFSIRLANAGYIEISTSEALAWHQHQNAPGKKGRPLSSIYYSSTNRIYVTAKHYGKVLALSEFIYLTTYKLALITKHILLGKWDVLPFDRASLRGLWHGIRNRMDCLPP